MDYSTPDFPVLHYLLEFAQTRQAKKSILDDILNGEVFDDTGMKMSIFTKSNWAQEWSKFAKCTADHELGIIMTNVSALAKQLATTISNVECIIVELAEVLFLIPLLVWD